MKTIACAPSKMQTPKIDEIDTLVGDELLGEADFSSDDQPLDLKNLFGLKCTDTANTPANVPNHSPVPTKSSWGTESNFTPTYLFQGGNW